MEAIESDPIALMEAIESDPIALDPIALHCPDPIAPTLPMPLPMLAEALQRLSALVMDEIRSSGNFTEATILEMIDTIMGAAIDFIKSGQRLLVNNIVNSTC